MATSIVMPQMGYDMQEGTVLKWHKKEGDEVARGEIIADIETDKATVEFEAFVGGVLRKIIAVEGATIPVGELIAVIGAADEALPDDLGVSSSAPQASASTAATAPAPALADAPARAPAADGEVRASPIARRLARERGIDLSTLTGSGPGGRIVEEDVLAHQAAPTTQEAAPTISDSEVRASPIARRLARERGIELAKIPGTGPGGRIVEEDVLQYQEPAVAVDGVAALTDERVELSRMRQTIAKVTSDSKRDAPHFYVTAEIDMTKAVCSRSSWAASS